MDCTHRQHIRELRVAKSALYDSPFPQVICAVIAVVIALIGMAPQASAQPPVLVRSSIADVPISRILRTIPMVQRDGLTVNVAVRDLGGSTDMTPTEQVYLTLYLKGEMFNIDAAFDLGAYQSVESAARLEAGIYEIQVVEFVQQQDFAERTTVTLRVDARQTTVDIRAVSCGDELDCNAARTFRSAVVVTKRLAKR